MSSTDALGVDWLGFSRRAAKRVRAALDGLDGVAERGRAMGRGEGGDTTLAIDSLAEDVVFEELEALGVGLRAVSEERGVVEVAGGGRTRVVIDPIDGSLNAKRGLPAYSLSIAVADGDDMSSVVFGYVADLARGEEWWAARGEGAFLDGERLTLRLPDDARLEILGVETADPRRVAKGADALAEMGAHRLRMIGSIALSLCYVASARFDGMLSLRTARSVDAAAGQLIVREAGGAVAFPDAEGAAGLDLDMRSRVFAAGAKPLLDELLRLAPEVQQSPRRA